MHKLLLIPTLLLMTLTAFAQEDKSKRPSPPATASATVNGKLVKIDYSQPSVKGRDTWKDLAPYGKVWRTGANEATVFEVDKDVKIEGKDLPVGRYALFTIPGEKEWTLIFNKTANQWGAFKYKEADDALRVVVPARKVANFQEKFKMDVSPRGVVSLAWADVQADFQVK